MNERRKTHDDIPSFLPKWHEIMEKEPNLTRVHMALQGRVLLGRDHVAHFEEYKIEKNKTGGNENE